MRRYTAAAVVTLGVLSGCASPSAPPRHIVAHEAEPGPTPTTIQFGTREEAVAVRTASLRARPARARVPRGDVWTALAQCESGGDPHAVSRSGRYRGAFQFSLRTWQSLGYSGDPIDHSYETQLEAAKRLQARSGWQQWPACSRRLGLR